MFSRPIPRLAVLALFALVPAACGDDGPSGPGGDLDEGTFQATVSGDLSFTLTGEAVFASINAGPGFTAWTLTLAPLSNQGDGSSVTLTRIGPRPGEGSHTLILNQQTDEGDFLSLTYHDGGGFAGILVGVSGTLQVTSSSSNRMRGSLQGTLEGTITVDGEPQDVTVTVNATFDAFGASF